MRYGLLGEDASPTAEKLDRYLGEVGWDYLRPHCQREALLFVDPAIDLREAGAAFADDDKERVAAWLRAGDVVRVNHLHAAQWEGGDARFEALVISPFVLFRPVG